MFLFPQLKWCSKLNVFFYNMLNITNWFNVPSRLWKFLQIFLVREKPEEAHTWKRNQQGLQVHVQCTLTHCTRSWTITSLFHFVTNRSCTLRSQELLLVNVTGNYLFHNLLNGYRVKQGWANYGPRGHVVWPAGQPHVHTPYIVYITSLC